MRRPGNGDGASRRDGPARSGAAAVRAGIAAADPVLPRLADALTDSGRREKVSYILQKVRLRGDTAKAPGLRHPATVWGVGRPLRSPDDGGGLKPLRGCYMDGTKSRTDSKPPRSRSSAQSLDQTRRHPVHGPARPKEQESPHTLAPLGSALLNNVCRQRRRPLDCCRKRPPACASARPGGDDRLIFCSSPACRLA